MTKSREGADADEPEYVDYPPWGLKLPIHLRYGLKEPSDGLCKRHSRPLPLTTPPPSQKPRQPYFKSTVGSLLPIAPLESLLLIRRDNDDDDGLHGLLYQKRQLALTPGLKRLEKINKVKILI